MALVDVDASSVLSVQSWSCASNMIADAAADKMSYFGLSNKLQRWM